MKLLNLFALTTVLGTLAVNAAAVTSSCTTGSLPSQYATGRSIGEAIATWTLRSAQPEDSDDPDVFWTLVDVVVGQIQASGVRGQNAPTEALYCREKGMWEGMQGATVQEICIRPDMLDPGTITAFCP
jgi:hypothetical protein